MLLENLREGSSAVTRWVANADRDSVHTSVRQRGESEENKDHEGDNQERGARCTRALARRGRHNVSRRGFHA